MGNPYAPKKRIEAKSESVEETVVEENSSELEIPSGNIDDLKEWVGEDSDRAQLLLDEENSHDKPRKTLVTHLEEIING